MRGDLGDPAGSPPTGRFWAAASDCDVDVGARPCSPRPGRRGGRRLTLAPPAWSGAVGSRFSCLGGLAAELSGELDLDEDHVAVRSALDAVEADGGSPDGSLPFSNSDEEIRRQFWVDAGFPTPESRFWERAVSPAAEGMQANDVHV